MGRPRYGVGVRYGASVSTSSRSSGATRRASRSGAAFLNVTVPAKRGARRGRGRPGRTRRRRRSSASPSARGRPRRRGPQHVVVGVAVVDDQRLVEPLGERRCGAGTTPPARPGPPRRCGSGRARSRPPRAPCRAPARAPRSRQRRVELAGRGQPGCLVGVQRDAGDQRVVRSPRPRPPTARRAGRSRSARSGARRPRRRRRRLLDREPVVAVGDVEVAVVVDDRVRQRLRGRGALAHATDPTRESTASATTCGACVGSQWLAPRPPAARRVR